MKSNASNAPEKNEYNRPIRVQVRDGQFQDTDNNARQCKTYPDTGTHLIISSHPFLTFSNSIFLLLLLFLLVYSVRSAHILNTLELCCCNLSGWDKNTAPKTYDIQRKQQEKNKKFGYHCAWDRMSSTYIIHWGRTRTPLDVCVWATECCL